MNASSSTRTSLPLSLQSFGISSDHRFSESDALKLRQIVYHDLVDELEYDPFFQQEPVYNVPFRKQQGSIEGAEYSESARGRPCGHVFGKGETVYRCRNCGTDETCVMCQKCYRASNHEGHDIVMSINGGSGGCCDCGDQEAWKLEFRCRYHYSETPADSVLQPAVPDEMEARLRQTISQILDFFLDVMSHAKDSAKPPQLDDDTSPELDVVRSRLTGVNYDGALESAIEVSWSTVLWNDEKHNFDEVIDIVKRACKIPIAQARKVASAVDSYGRSTVYTGELKEALRIAEFLARIRLGVTVRCARDVFREDMVEVLINFLQDIAHLTLNLSDGTSNSDLIRVLICEEMCKPWQQGVRPYVAVSAGDESALPIADSEDGKDEDSGQEEEEDTEMIGEFETCCSIVYADTCRCSRTYNRLGS